MKMDVYAPQQDVIPSALTVWVVVIVSFLAMSFSRRLVVQVVPTYQYHLHRVKCYTETGVNQRSDSTDQMLAVGSSRMIQSMAA